MTTFNDLGLAEPILRAVSAEGYTSPTPIQAQGIPAVLSGRDLVGIAQTGTGKTAAFVLPLLHRLAAENRRPAEKTAHALILAPTRELAEQIGESIRSYSRHMHVTHAVVIGGANPRTQAAKLSRGVDIIVATPGRLLDHMQARVVSLSQVRQVVLDEADQMLDMGFIPAIRKIMAKVNPERQTLLFSATMPKEIRRLADDFMGEPLEVSVAPASKPIETIDQTVMHLDGGAKRGVLVSLLQQGDMDRTIVFTRTKRGADRVARTVAGAGIKADALHGNKSQNQRQRTLDAFRKGKLQVLIATDIAARGIDIDDISHVVNFDLPMVPEAYVHRIGRTARAGRSGQAISLCAHDERKLLRQIEKLTGKGLRAVDPPPPADVPEGPVRGHFAEAPVANGRGDADEAARKPRRPRRKPAGAGKPFGKPSATADGARPRRAKPEGGNGAAKPRAGKPKSQGSRSPQNRDGLTRMLGGSKAA